MREICFWSANCSVPSKKMQRRKGAVQGDLLVAVKSRVCSLSSLFWCPDHAASLDRGSSVVNGQVSSEFRLNVSGSKDMFFSGTRLLFYPSTWPLSCSVFKLWALSGSCGPAPATLPCGLAAVSTVCSWGQVERIQPCVPQTVFQEDTANFR